MRASVGCYCILFLDTLPGGEEAVLCLRTALPWITRFFSLFFSMKAKHRHLCVCAHTCFLRASPATCLKLLSANIPILPSLHHFPSFPLSSHSVHFPLTALSCLFVVPWLLRERLHSSIPLINSLLSQSLLVFLFFFFFLMLSPPISSSPPFFSCTSIWCASFSHFAQLCSSAAYLLRLIHHYFLSMSTSSTFSFVISLSFPP